MHMNQKPSFYSWEGGKQKHSVSIDFGLVDVLNKRPTQERKQLCCCAAAPFIISFSY